MAVTYIDARNSRMIGGGRLRSDGGDFRCVRKIAKSDLLLSCPSVCMEQLYSHWTDHHAIWYLAFFFFSKISRENSRFIKIWQEYQVLYMKTDIHFWSYLAQFFLEWEMFQTKVVEKIKTHILCPILFPPENCAVYEIMWKIRYSRTGLRWQYNMAHVLCMLDTQGYRHTLRICNIYCFPTAKIVTRTGLNLTLYVPYIACLVLCLQRMRKQKRKSSRNLGWDTNPGPSKHEGNT